MFKDSEVRIGINVGKAGKEDRGITKYTRSILSEFNNVGPDSHFVLLHYPNSAPENNFGLNNAESQALPYTDDHKPLVTIINEQVLNPLQQKGLDLDVVWHPHNRCQLLTPVGYVSTMHDVLPIAVPELAGNYLNKKDKMLLYESRTLTASKADVVITASEFSRQEIIKHLGVDPKKVIKIYSGIDRNVFKPNTSVIESKRIKDSYSLPDRYLLTTGSYAPHKNLKTLVDAYSESNLPDKNVGLVMVGPNDATGYRIGYQELVNHVQELGIAEKVRLLPSVPLADLVSIYSNSMMFASPSLYEGFGFTPLEAMSCGVPVVASNTTALPEVCENAVLYANPHDASSFANQFNLLLDDRDLRESLIVVGNSQVLKFDWKETARRTLEVLNNVAKSRK